MKENYEEVSFKPAITQEELDRIEEKAQKDTSISRRIGLVVLTKDNTELEEMATKNPETSLEAIDQIAAGAKAYKDLAEILDTASARLLAAMINVEEREGFC